MRVGHVLTEAVRSVVTDIQKKRILLLLFEKVQRVFGDDIGIIPWLGVYLFIPDGFVIIKRLGMSARFSEPVGEPGLRLQAIS